MESIWHGRFLPGNGLSPEQRGCRHNSGRKSGYNQRMDPMLNIPTNRKRVPVWRLCLLLGLTALLFLMIANTYGAALAALDNPASAAMGLAEG
jgi:hypothetical protein